MFLRKYLTNKEIKKQMLDQIYDSLIDTAEDRSVLWGAGGAAAGGALAVQQRFSMLPAVATILGGHYLGHFAYSAMNPKSW